jgi:CheY-like chemotaxis protein
MTSPYRISVHGFSAFERSALRSYFRLARERTPAYEQVDAVADSHFLIVDADHADAVQAALDAGRMSQTVFIGGKAPQGATAWMLRPIDPLHVLRELDVMVAMHGAVALPDAAAVVRGADAILPIRTLRGSGPGPADAPRRRAGDAPRIRVEPDSVAAAEAAAARAALLVDDSEIALRFLETRLQPLGLQTQRATSSGKAIELLSHHRYDFVFIDVELGPDSDLDGLALCQYVKRLHRHAGSAPSPVVAIVSAHRSELDRVRGALAGCDAYLGKPLDELALRRLLTVNGVEPAAEPAAEAALAK